MRFLVCFSLVLFLIVPAMAIAAGGHEGLSCTGCHSIHDAKGDIIFAVTPNTQAVNPRMKKPYAGVTALCLGCHETVGGMGIAPISGNKSHPYGIVPNTKIAAVPAAALRDGKLECVGCHDPHPSNPNHKYLRIATSGGSNMADFCSLCHSSKSGKSIPASMMFSSMDETKAKAKKEPKKTTSK